MRTMLLLELEPGVDPVSAAREFSKAPRVVQVVSFVDERPMEIWRRGVHAASETGHPMVDRAKRSQEAAIEAALRGPGES